MIWVVEWSESPSEHGIETAWSTRAGALAYASAHVSPGRGYWITGLTVDDPNAEGPMEFVEPPQFHLGRPIT